MSPSPNPSDPQNQQQHQQQDPEEKSPSPTSLDLSSHPSTFQRTWQSNPDPTALPFPRSSPPFPLTPTDWHQLSLPDTAYTPHTWTSLHTHIRTHNLNALTRQPSHLKAYLAWSTHVQRVYGSATAYLLQQRLGWRPVSAPEDKVLRFRTWGEGPLRDKRDWKVLRNDWGYGVGEGITHLVVWSKWVLPVDGEGGLSGEGWGLVEGFVRRVFRARCGEVGVDEGEGEEDEIWEKEGDRGIGSKVLWFKNTTVLQSVRAVEHVHVLVRDVGEDLLAEWTNGD